jgi:P-type E1-E2 ATPase
VKLLRRAGAAPVILSGDSEETTRAVSSDLGVADSRARLTPEDKAAFVAALQAEGRRVAMIGDGINDAPSLAQADLSITVAGGTDVAGETSDVVFSRRDLSLAPWFLGLSAATRRVIRQNLGWALGYNLVAVPIAALGLITPGIAAAAMATSSLLVVGNSLRLRRVIAKLEA